MALPDSRIPGTYRIDYRVRAADRTGGRYERTTRQSLQVRVRPELASSDVKVASAGKILLGPGFSSRFAREVLGLERFGEKERAAVRGIAARLSRTLGLGR